MQHFQSLPQIACSFSKTTAGWKNQVDEGGMLQVHAKQRRPANGNYKEGKCHNRCPYHKKLQKSPFLDEHPV